MSEKNTVKSFRIGNLMLVENSLALVNEKTGQQVRIGTHDFLTLYELCCNAGNIVTKETLLEKGWPGKIVSESSLTQSIRNIRNLIGDNGKEQKWLKTVSKVGYLLDAEVVIKDHPMSSTTFFNSLKNPKKSKKPFINNKTKVVILSCLMVSLAFLSGKLYLKYSFTKGNGHYPNTRYDNGIIQIYSDKESIAVYVGESINQILQSTHKKPQKIAILLQENNLSYAIINSEGKIYNKLLIIDKNTSDREIHDIILKEVTNALS
ncbi:winged helix-turn-helix domain-containing protein [Vibrio caribbeanicus]|uniref:winged helix-turn-helix domain-containing protein n=1 Tax=Vibrio caribbeanicus TaxID=701175 RepID=UPI0030D9CE0B